jgi:hypothetical protein
MHVTCFVQAWIESFPPTLVTIATFGSALLGFVVAIYPPEKEGNTLKKGVYIALFAILGVVGVSADVWQRSIERGRQEVSQAHQTAAEIRFSADLNEVKASNNAILQFVANPPKGYTKEQVSTFVKAYVESRDSRRAPVSSAADRSISQYETLTNDQLCTVAKQVADEIDEYMGTWRSQLKDVGLRYDEQTYYKSPPPSEDERRILEKARENDLKIVDQQYAIKSKDLFARANDVRGVLVNRLSKKKGGQPPTGSKIDEVVTRLATAGAADASDRDPQRASAYLLELCKRLGSS